MSENVNQSEKLIENMLKITEDISDAKDTLSDAKIILDLSEDSARISLHGTFCEQVDREIPSVNLEESIKFDTVSDISEVTVNESKSEVTIEEVNNSVIEKKPDPKENSKFIWVSNLTNNIRANDLKKLFGKYGKVVNAKILSNGRNFYGYLCMDTAEEATTCIKELHNSEYASTMLHVARHRPFMKKDSVENKELKPKLPVNKIKMENKKDISLEKSKLPSEKKPREVVTTKHSDDDNKLISDLQRRLKNAYADVSRLKRKLTDHERKSALAERNSKKEIDKLRADRRRLNQDKEDFETIKKIHQKQMSNEKVSVTKELDEVKALRVKLQNRLDNFLTSTPRASQKSRSPIFRTPMENTLSPQTRRYGDGDYRNAKRVRRQSPIKVRISPPAPPVLSEFDRRRPHRDEHFPVNRPYYSDERRSNGPEKSMDFRHKHNADQSSTVNRNSYPMNYPPKDPRRPPVLVQPFVSDRFGNNMQKASGLLGPSRGGHNHYVPEYGKPYGHY